MVVHSFKEQNQVAYLVVAALIRGRAGYKIIWFVKVCYTCLCIMLDLSVAFRIFSAQGSFDWCQNSLKSEIGVLKNLSRIRKLSVHSKQKLVGSVLLQS